MSHQRNYSLAVGSTILSVGSLAFAQFDWWSWAHIDDLTVRRNLVVNATGFSTIAMT